jgi:hypothetical protein
LTTSLALPEKLLRKKIGNFIYFMGEVQMAGSIDVEIKAAESPIKNALDHYYSFLVDLFPPSKGQRLALNSTSVTFDILKDSSLYNEYVFRAFADRTIVASPTKFEPIAMGPGNISNRFSYSYIELLRRLARDLDSKLTQEAKDQIKLIERDIKASRVELDNEYKDMITRWIEYKKAEGIKDDDPYLLDKQTAFYNTYNFAERIKQIKNDISDKLMDIDIIRDRGYPDDDARQIMLFMRYATLSQYLMTRPTTPMLEAKLKYDEVRIAQMWIYENLAYFETSVEVKPSGFLDRFIENVGEKSFKVIKQANATHQHDVDWHTSASGGWGFWKARVNTDYEKHVRESITKIQSVEVGFKNISEYWVRRGQWYSNTIFDFARTQTLLKKNPTLAANLAQVVSSVIIGRGMWVKFYFQDQNDYKEWDKLSISGGVGYDFFGMTTANLAGSYNESNINTYFNNTEKSVTFTDSETHCRLVGFKIDALMGDNTDLLLALERGDWEEVRAKIGIIDDYMKGKMTSHDFELQRNALVQQSLQTIGSAKGR